MLNGATARLKMKAVEKIITYIITEDKIIEVNEQISRRKL
jgi:hypothetical protein